MRDDVARGRWARLLTCLVAGLLVALPALIPTTATVASAAPTPATTVSTPDAAYQPVPFGAAPDLATSSVTFSHPVVGMVSTPDGQGFWLVASDGGVFAFGNAQFYGSMGAQPLNQPIVGMATTPDGHGYWLVAADGGVFSFGDAHFFGSTGGLRLDQPVVGMATSSTGNGYWLVASDGGIFSFGNARFHGSMGGRHLDRPIVGMASSGNGYWLVASDGGIFAFGGAPFDGSLGGQTLNAPVVGMAPSPDGNGYWLTAADGGVFAFGGAQFLGSLGFSGSPTEPESTYPIAAIAPLPDGGGYWLLPSTVPPVDAPQPGAPPCEQAPTNVGPLVEPSTITLGCATSADVLDPVTWSEWSVAGARGTAIEHLNLCQPDCAGGSYISFPDDVQLSNVGYVDGWFLFRTIATTPTGSEGTAQSLTTSGLAWGWT